MKRFHVHIAVTDIESSVQFYNRLFGQIPTIQRDDYAKWTLEDPQINFVASARGHAPGVNHMGIEVATPQELLAEKKRTGFDLTEIPGELGEAACCDAKNEEHWTLDPQGIAWEYFQTPSDTEEHSDGDAKIGTTCCTPIRKSENDTSLAKASCCIPSASSDPDSACCG